MSCLREVQTISQSPHILPMPSLTRLTSGGVLNPLKNTTNTSHNELLHQDPLQPPLEPRVRAVGSSPLTRGKHGNTMPLGALIGLIPAHAGKTLRQRRPRPRQRAHPRSRGENPSWIWCLPRRRGSSPLTRGKHGPAERTPAPEGLIPAHAGKTGTYGARLPHPTAHPRSRGENPLRLRSSAAAAGSSPLTRGKHSRRCRQLLDSGLIPAHAGKTTRPAGTRRARRAHPRSRGENENGGKAWNKATGSSPLTRGKHQVTVLDRGDGRLIPAHAGKTPQRGSRPRRAEAHPRSRGENLNVSVEVVHAGGSSPLTRGKPHGRGGPAGEPGLIPAHAGKTSPAPERRAWGPAHPRSRGENFVRVRPARSWLGSSPLTRGKRVLQGDKRIQVRLIPAHAGKTLQARPAVHLREAHPRSRGENSVADTEIATHRGSSPLTRGKQRRRYGDCYPPRLIPAHAGKTSGARSGLIRAKAHPRSRGENYPACST